MLDHARFLQIVYNYTSVLQAHRDILCIKIILDLYVEIYHILCRKTDIATYIPTYGRVLAEGGVGHCAPGGRDATAPGLH